MKVYNLTEYKEVWCCGDPHGHLKDLTDKLLADKATNTLVIVLGDIGIGFGINYADELKDLFRKCTTALEILNSKLVLLRGNHDNPELFTGTSTYQTDSILLIPDYSILRTSKGDILCIGGARSIDKCYRIESMTWWPEEMIPMVPENLYDDLDKENIKVSIVCTHTGPTFAEPVDKSVNDQGQMIELISMTDKTLKQENYDEREKLKGIALNLKFHKHPFKFWLYGHFHAHFMSEFDKTSYICLDMVRFNLDNKHEIIFDIFKL